MDLNKRVQCGILLVSGQYSSVLNTPEESAGLRSQPRLLIRIITSNPSKRNFLKSKKIPIRAESTYLRSDGCFSFIHIS